MRPANNFFISNCRKLIWYWNDLPMTHKSGYSDANISGEMLELETILNRDDDVSAKIKKHVNLFYKPCFITLEDRDDLAANGDNSLLTGIINDSFSAKSLKPLQKFALDGFVLIFPKRSARRFFRMWFV